MATPIEPSDTSRPVAQAAIDSQRSWQPPGLFLLFIVEMWERFSYYGMRALLVLYLVRSVTGDENGFNPGRGWSSADATLLYGWYTGMAYLLPIVGGLIADRLLGTHRSMIVGGLVIALGHILLAISGLGSWEHDAAGMSMFIAGLAMIVLGTGHFKPCVSVMVGQLYRGPDDPRRDGGFSIFYMGINLGAFLCAFVVGTLGEKVGWHWGFGAAAVGMFLGLAAYVAGRPRFLRGVGEAPPRVANWSIPFIGISIGLAVLVGLFFHYGGFAWLRATMAKIVATVGFAPVIGVLLAGCAALIGWLLAIQQRGDRAKVLAIIAFILFNTFFWMAFEQAGSTLNLFAEAKTDRSLALFGGWVMPASWFQSVNPLIIILLAPVFAFIWPWLSRRGAEPLQAGKIGIGLILLGIGYLFMVYAGAKAIDGVKVGMTWLMLTYLFHTLGELCLSPTGLSFVTKTAPLRFVSLLMGIWFLSSFAAGVLGGTVGSFVERIEKGEMTLPWAKWFTVGGQGDFFLLFVFSSVGAGVVCLALGPILNRMSGEVRSSA